MLQNKKSLGQNWLKNRLILEELAESAMLPLDDPEESQPLCLEIGPGLGTLTSSLLRRFPKVLAIEYDEKLAKNLPNSFPGKNLEVKHQDFLQFDLDTIKEPYVVAGNIPYYITSPIIQRLISAKNAPRRIVLLMQKEVADRLLLGQGKYTYLTLAVLNFADVFPGVYVDRSLFTPPPKVDSASVILVPRKKPIVDEKVLKFIKQCFANPRKKLITCLPLITSQSRDEIKEIYRKLNFDENFRPADLNLSDWQNLYDLL